MYNMHNTRPHSACNCANSVSGVNKYAFHVGHPEVLNVSLEMLNNFSFLHILCLVYIVQPLDNFIKTYLCNYEHRICLVNKRGTSLHS